jgi:light-regulated signal transduction histidine kinase (bacteriophytochrome)
MRSAGERMQKLIQDLLTFSRVSTKAQPFVAVNLDEVAREVMSDLEVSIEQAGATVMITELPMLQADPLQMRQLVQNLVGNALKFRKPGVAPVIKLYGRHTKSAGRREDVWEISVEDNGIGFDEKYLDRIFTVFQRLHGRAEYEGSGVGLAVCRKIAERHNGTITARSTPGEGATFTVTLPLKQNSSEGTNNA